MPTVERQLRDYFDAGVERISVADVIAQAEVREGRLEPLQPQRTLRPAWAAVGAFAATIVGLGSLAAVLTMTQRLAGEFGSDATEIIQTDGGTVGLWLVAGLVAAVAAAAVTWMMRRPAKQEDLEIEHRGKVTVMETIEDTRVDTAEAPGAPSRWPIALIVLLAVAVVGLIAWMTLAMRPNSPNAAPGEIQQLMEDYAAAWNAQDPDALEALVTDSYRIHGPDYMESPFDHDMASVTDYLWPMLADWEWQTTEMGPVYAVSNGGTRWYVSNEGSTITRSGTDHAQNGVWMVVEVDGEYLVAEHFMMGG